MAIEDAIKTRLEGSAELTALVADRIRWKRGEHNIELPALVYRKMGHEPTRAMGADTTLQRTRWAFIALAHHADEAEAVMRAVKTRLNRLQDATVDGVSIDSIFFEDAADVDLGEDIQAEAVSQMYQINFRE